MKPDDSNHVDYSQPVAYDTQGRPLYLRPQAALSEPKLEQPVTTPEASVIDEAASDRHQRSRQLYPNVSLNEAEYIVTRVRRHPIGIFTIWIGEAAAMTIIISLWITIVLEPEAVGGLLKDGAAQAGLFAAVMLVQLILLAVGWIGTIIYKGNRFFVTNERIIQYIRTGLFSYRRNTINLGGIEDVRYEQDGIIQSLVGYGSIRLSTIGSETTYPFAWVDNPRVQTRNINSIVMAYKHQRPTPLDVIDEDLR